MIVTKHTVIDHQIGERDIGAFENLLVCSWIALLRRHCGHELADEWQKAARANDFALGSYQ
jgi:hypothetical protein